MLVPASVSEPDVFRVISVTLGVRPVLWLTLYGVGMVQLTETEEAGFALIVVLDTEAVAGAEIWQLDTTVAETLSEAVRVVARAGLEARPDASKPKANVKVAYFMDFTRSVTSQERLR